jgi:hypothetical protein
MYLKGSDIDVYVMECEWKNIIQKDGDWQTDCKHVETKPLKI